MAINFIPSTDYPDLIFGLVGPIGVDLEYIEESLKHYLNQFNYRSIGIRITEIMQEIKCSKKIYEQDIISSYKTKIDYANEIRKIYESNDILAAVSIGAIKRLRPALVDQRGVAFIIRQLKTPEEIALLRSVYGRLFIQVSIYGAPSQREARLVSMMKIKSKGILSDKDARDAARELIERDQKERQNIYGQNVSDAFPLGDVFVDSFNRAEISNSLERFINSLFGSNEVSPTHEEYGMYLAKTASLRSNDLSRQVGSAIFAESGEVISLGSNEVPRAGGGTYWTGDKYDARDIMLGHDPNDLSKNEIFSDIVSLLHQDNFFSDEFKEMSASEVVENLLSREGGRTYGKSRIMDIIEFGRIIHAEMSAICDAARNGVSTKDGILYCTTFPCHICAKHIVAAGIKKVVYLEPYPKSYARQLHGDSIQIEEEVDGNKVVFKPFIGISPFRYRDLFERGRRKNKDGVAAKWKSEQRRPNIQNIMPIHLQAEEYVIANLTPIITSKNQDPDT